jgi:hypothetical protein
MYSIVHIHILLAYRGMDKAGAPARKLFNDSSANRVDIAGVELPLANLQESRSGSWVSEKNSSRQLGE